MATTPDFDFEYETGDDHDYYDDEDMITLDLEDADPDIVEGWDEEGNPQDN